MKPKPKYKCQVCSAVHDDYSDASHCCPVVAEVWQCSECQQTYPEWHKDEALACCVYDKLHDFGDIVPTCLCGERATDADIRDSQLLGTLLRCRACILRIAPELIAA